MYRVNEQHCMGIEWYSSNSKKTKMDRKTCTMVDKHIKTERAVDVFHTNLQSALVGHHYGLKCMQMYVSVSMWFSEHGCLCMHVCVALLNPRGTRQNDRKEDKLQ